MLRRVPQVLWEHPGASVRPGLLEQTEREVLEKPRGLSALPELWARYSPVLDVALSSQLVTWAPQGRTELWVRREPQVHLVPVLLPTDRVSLSAWRSHASHHEHYPSVCDRQSRRRGCQLLPLTMACHCRNQCVHVFSTRPMGMGSPVVVEELATS